MRSIVFEDLERARALLLLLVLLVVFWIVFGLYCLIREPPFRRKITGSWLWKKQWLYHPVIIFCFLLPGARGACIAPCGPCLAPLLLALLSAVAFNCGADWGQLLQKPGLRFILCYYLHHVAPLLAFVRVAASPELPLSFVVAQALAFTQAWGMHTVLDLKHRGVIDWESPKIIAIYHAIGLPVIVFFCVEVARQAASQASSFQDMLVLGLPLALQYGTRWGLWGPLLKMSPEVDNKFDRAKQKIEPASFALGAAVACATQWATQWPVVG